MSDVKNMNMRAGIAKSLVATERFDDLHKSIVETCAPGLLNLSDDAWYPVSNMITAVQKLVESRASFDSTFDMVAIGKSAAEQATLPDGITLEAFLEGQQATIDYIYDGAEKGYGKAERIGHNHYRIEVDLPWPSDVMYGNYYGFAKRLLPEGTRIHIKKADGYQEGDTPMVFYLQWE